jgi:hypothetical protein
MVVVCRTDSARIAPPPPSPEQVWLDRLDRDTAAVPVNGEAGMALLRRSFLTDQAYLLAPTEARRAAALAAIDADVRAGIDEHQSAEQDLMWRVGCAAAHANLNDAPGARRWLAEADAPATTAPTTNPMVSLGGGFTDAFRIETELLLGDRSLLDKSELGWLSYTSMVDELAWGGHPAEARLVVDRARAVATMHVKKPAEMQNPLDERGVVVQDLLTLGDRPAAFKAVAEIAGMTPDESHHRDIIDREIRSALEKIALDALRAGDHEDYLNSRRAAVETLARPPLWDLDRIPDWCRLCLRAGDREGFDAFADAMRREMKSGDSTGIMDVMERAELAGLCWRIGEKDQYKSLMAGLEANMPGVASRAGRGSDRDRQETAQEYFYLAAAYARAGDKPAVDRNVSRALAAGKLDDGNLGDGWNDVADGYADAGLLDDAMAADAKNPDIQYRSVAVLIARRLAAAGRVDEAWKLAGSLTPRYRVFAEYALAVEQTRAGRLDDLNARADAARTPQERALIDLAVSQTLAGKPYAGMLKVYRPNDD